MSADLLRVELYFELLEALSRILRVLAHRELLEHTLEVRNGVRLLLVIGASERFPQIEINFAPVAVLGIVLEDALEPWDRARIPANAEIVERHAKFCRAQPV